MDEMTITMAKYTRDADTNEVLSLVATIDDQPIIVPLDPANRHYAEIMRQVEAGELTIQEAD